MRHIRLLALVLATLSSTGCRHALWLCPLMVDTAVVGTAVAVSASQPPPPQYVYPAPRAGYVWQQGYWSNQGGQWVWVPGRWVPAVQGYAWQPAHWEQAPDGSWHMIQGRWVGAP